MRLIPTADQATPILTRLATLTTATMRVRAGKPSEIDHGDAGYIRARIAHHLQIARTHPSMPDGYPTHTSGSDPSTGHTGVLEGESVPLTSVEAAVEARQRWKDEHDQLTTLAYSYVADATFALAAAKQTLEKLDHLATLDDTLGLADDRWCENHLRHGQHFEPRAGDGGRYCRWCADINRRCGAYPNHILVDYMHRNGRRLPYNIIRLQFPDWRPDKATA